MGNDYSSQRRDIKKSQKKVRRAWDRVREEAEELEDEYRLAVRLAKRHRDELLAKRTCVDAVRLRKRAQQLRKQCATYEAVHNRLEDAIANSHLQEGMENTRDAIKDVANQISPDKGMEMAREIAEGQDRLENISEMLETALDVTGGDGDGGGFSGGSGVGELNDEALDLFHEIEAERFELQLQAPELPDRPIPVPESSRVPAEFAGI